MKKICVIGNVGDGNKIGGQISKTNELVNGLRNIEESIKFYNVYGENPISFLMKTRKLMKEHSAMVVILASPGYFKILPTLIFFQIFYKCDIYEVVIGGIRQQYIAGNLWRIFLERKISCIFVESNYMVQEYKEIGLNNAKYLPNMKKIQITKESLLKHDGSNLKLCTFSRIDRYKGIDAAIDIVTAINDKDEDKVYLDIYGPIDENFRQQFETKLAESDHEYVNYKGLVENAKSTEILSNYDLMIFPTRWKAEGFPGSFIDAYSAGLPIVSSYRENFMDIIQDHVNGCMVDENDLFQFESVIRELRDDRSLLQNMKRAALKSAALYDRDYVVKILYHEINDYS